MMIRRHTPRLTRLLRIIMSIQRIHLILLQIIMMKRKPKNNRSEKRRDRDARIHPHDSRISRGGDESFRKGGSNGVGEEVHGLDEGFHRWWGFGVCVFEPGDRDEDFCETDEDVCGCLDYDVDVVWERGLSNHARWTLSW